MAKARIYPGADRSQWRGGNRPVMPDIDMLLLHTTESSGWPSYPSFAPTLTFNPWVARGKRWRQHYFIDEAATTLKSFDSYKTNRQNVCQIEIVAWVDPVHSDARSFYTNISWDAYNELAEFYAWLHREWGTVIGSTVKWKEYPSSYGVNNGVRLSRSQFTAYQGLCGHMHAPDQSHGDPSLIKVDYIVQQAKKIIEGDDDMPLNTEDLAKIRKIVQEEVAGKFSEVWKSAEVDVLKAPPSFLGTGEANPIQPGTLLERIAVHVAKIEAKP